MSNKILQVIKNILILIGLFIIDQIVSLPQIEAMKINHNVVAQIILVIIYVITTVAAITVFYTFYRHKLQENHSRFGITKPNLNVLWFMLMMVVVWYLFMILQGWLLTKYHIDNSPNQKIINTMYHNLPWWTFIDGTLVAPVMEELIFRGIFFELFFRQDKTIIKVIGVVVNGALFGLLHDTGINFPIYAVMGMLLAITYMHTKDVRYSIALHVFNNFITFI